jgi:PAS domain S-box-containing protein
VLIAAPYGRDARSLADLLAAEGYSAEPFSDIAQIAAAIDDSTGALLLTDDALSTGLAELGLRLAAEPQWSDLPVVLLAGRHSPNGTDHDRLRRQLPASATNLIILERPLGGVSLVSAIQSALRARQRQFQMRDSIADLAESESRLRLATSAADIGTWDYDPVEGTLLWDDRCRALFGLPPDAAVSYADSFLAGLHPDDRSRADLAVNNALLNEGGKYDIEYRTVGLRDGVERWIAAKGGAVFRDGKAVRFIGTVRDISTRKRAELALESSAAALKEESDALATLTDIGKRVAAELDLDRLVEHVVDAGVELTGAEFGAFFYNRVDEEGESYMLYALSGTARSNFENFPMPRNTAVFAPTFGGTGPVRSGDIRKDDCYGHSAPYHGMPEGHLPVASYLAVPVTSRSGDVLGGLFFGHAKQDVFDARAEKLALGLAAQAAVAIDNARLFQSSQRLNKTLEARVVDRTQALEAEMERRAQTEAALRQSQKMEAVGQLTGGIAHDFNNMLTGVISGLDIVANRIAAGRYGDVERFMDAARSSAQRAAGLTSRLLTFSRRQSLDARPIDVNALIEALADLLRRSLTEQIEFLFTPGEELPLAVADANQLESALLNLAINARDAMASGGRLTIATHVQDIAAPTDGELAAGRYIAIVVRDNGTGIPADVLEKVFEPFYTTKPIGQGTGLGLSMVFGFVRQSGGDIRIESVPGEGTTITLLLPLAKEGTVAATPQQGGVVAGDGQAVLLVEDDDAVRLLVADLLSELGYSALEAADPDSALKILRSSAKVDLLITDVGLPKMNGRRLAEIARQLQPDLPVLFLTGYTQIAATRGDLIGDDMAMIAKPFVMEELSSKIQEMLGKS